MSTYVCVQTSDDDGEMWCYSCGNHTRPSFFILLLTLSIRDKLTIYLFLSAFQFINPSIFILYTYIKKP